jgi:hypothetical protein
MPRDRRTPPRNRDLDQPRRTGEPVQPTMSPEQRERVTGALPEEETYEREPRSRDQSDRD